MSTLTPGTERQVTADERFVYVVFGVYSDMSGSKVLGVYTHMEAAQDRTDIMREAGCNMSVNYAKVPMNKAFGVELRP